MLKFIAKIIMSALAAMIGSYLLPGVHVNEFTDALILAAVLALLNAVLKPLLIILTIPITIMSLGLFLLVINAIIIMVGDRIVSGFSVDSFWWALLFSIILSLITSIFDSFNKKMEKKE